MGLAESGRNMIRKKFLDEKYVPQKNRRYLPTIDYEIHKRTILGTEFAFYNLGGQTAFLERFFGELTENIFGEIDTLVYIVDVIQVPSYQRIKYYFDKACEKTRNYNPEASIFVFLNKMDLLDQVPQELKEEVCQTIKNYLLTDTKIPKNTIRVYETSLFTNSIIKAIEDVYRANITIFDDEVLLETENRDDEVAREDRSFALSLQEALTLFQQKEGRS